MFGLGSGVDFIWLEGGQGPTKWQFDNGRSLLFVTDLAQALDLDYEETMEPDNEVRDSPFEKYKRRILLSRTCVLTVCVHRPGCRGYSIKFMLSCRKLMSF